MLPPLDPFHLVPGLHQGSGSLSHFPCSFFCPRLGHDQCAAQLAPVAARWLSMTEFNQPSIQFYAARGISYLGMRGTPPVAPSISSVTPTIELGPPPPCSNNPLRPYPTLLPPPPLLQKAWGQMASMVTLGSARKRANHASSARKDINEEWPYGDNARVAHAVGRCCFSADSGDACASGLHNGRTSPISRPRARPRGVACAPRPRPSPRCACWAAAPCDRRRRRRRVRASTRPTPRSPPSAAPP